MGSRCPSSSSLSSSTWECGYGAIRPISSYDLAVLVASAIAVTGLLAICSDLLLGQFNFIAPTVKSARYLSRASELRANHSTSWSWAPYDAYLLVPPAIALSYVLIVAGRRPKVGTAQLFIGLTGALQLAAFMFLQFLSSFQALEMYYFSSVLWSSVNIMLAVSVAEVTRPFLSRGVAEDSDDSAPERQAAGTVRMARWIAGAVPALLVLAVALAYEGTDKAGLHIRSMTWAWGAVVAVILIAAAIVGRLTIEWRSARHRSGTGRLAHHLASAGAAVVMIGAALILTTAPPGRHGQLADTVYDPAPPYAKALGGNDSAYVARYIVLSELPGFVGHAAYRGEALLTWAPSSEFGELLGPMGIYHNAITWASRTFPVLGRKGVRKIESWRAAQVLIMSLTGRNFAQAVRSLARFKPDVVRRAILHHGSYHLHVWLVDLGRYLRRTST